MATNVAAVPDPTICVQAVNIDYYMESADTAESLGHEVPHPVIRLYGSTADGTRTCAHVHGVFPYLYFRPENMQDPMFASRVQVETYVHIIEKAIETGVQDLRKKSVGGEWRSARVVRQVSVVERKTMYGFYAESFPFVKVSFWRPQDVPYVANVLQVGILGRVMQPYESHAPYLLQFAMDYSIPGMGYLTASNIMVRQPPDRRTIIPETSANSCLEQAAPCLQSSLLDGVTYSQLMWSQDPFCEKSVIPDDDSAQVQRGTAGESDCADQAPVSAEKYLLNFRPSVLSMTSTCELEIDLHESFIIVDGSDPSVGETRKTAQKETPPENAAVAGDDNNAVVCCVGDAATIDSYEPCSAASSSTSATPPLSHVRSLGEIWREEARRRRAKGLPEEAFQTPPFTDTTHREIGRFEQDFSVRKNRLLDRAKSNVSSCSDVMPWVRSQEQHNDEVELFTQAVCTGDIGVFPRLLDDHKAPFISNELMDPRNGVANGIDIDDEEEECWASQYQGAVEEIHEILSSCSHQEEDMNHLIESRIDLSTLDGRSSPDSKPPSAEKASHATQRRSRASRRSSHTLLSTLGGEMAPVAGNTVNSHSPRLAWSRAPMTPSVAPVCGPDKSRDSFLSPYTAFMSNYVNSPAVNVSDSSQQNPPNSTRANSIDKHSIMPFREHSIAAKKLSFSLGSNVFIDNSALCRPNLDCTVDETFKCKESPLDLDCLLNIERRLVLVPKYPAPSLNSIACNAPHESIDVHQRAFYGNRITGTIPGNCRQDILGLNKEHFQFADLDLITHGVNLGVPNILDTIMAPAGGRLPVRRRCMIPTFKPPMRCQICPYRADGSGRDVGASVMKYSEGENVEMAPTHNSEATLQSRRRRPESQLLTPTQTQPVAAGVSMKVTKQAALTDAPSPAGHLPRQKRDYPVLITMVVEVLSQSRKDLLPNPKIESDKPRIALYEVVEACYTADSEKISRFCGCIVLSDESNFSDSKGKPTFCNSLASMKTALRSSLIPCPVYRLAWASSEHDFFLQLISVVRTIDPDFMIGYDVQGSSWGWLISRASALKPPIDLLQELSRIPNDRASNKNDSDVYGEDHESGIWITGRTVINVWRRMKEELKLSRYTIQNTAAHVLKKRLPEFSCQQLNTWFSDRKTQYRVFKHLYRLTSVTIDLIDSLDIIRRTAESAVLYGIDFFSVLTRGSQYRVEAVMLRVAHKLGYIAMSPSKDQVTRQAAMEVIPLVMEPFSDFYTEPVVILDFQSLYPSMICAYNLCFSTIMGKLAPGTNLQQSETTGRLGASEYPEDATVKGLEKHILGQSADAFVAPNGSIFVHHSVRRGILPLMLQEILDTRQMVKRSMKIHKGVGDDVLQRVLDARQLALKMISNVTYGYTAAGFSGRMPMAELADAVVQCGRSTLESSIRHIETHPTWRAKVVYGDTDSVFVLMKGRTKEEAFRLGHEIANAITEINPKGVVLKFEKVYLPSILVSKKRYVGYCFETEDQLEGHLDAKGIEMVRRDNCLVTTKLQEKALRLLFKSKDLTMVKDYLTQQWTKICIGLDKVPLKDFIFSKEVRLGHYATGPGGLAKSLPPGAIVAHKAMLYDPMRKPPYRWRVPYVVCIGEPGARLKDLVVSPHEVLNSDGNLRINHMYYIVKMILPALRRLLILAGVDVEQWFRDMPKPAPRLKRRNAGPQLVPGQTTITQYMQTENCVVCQTECTAGKINADVYSGRICSGCMRKPQTSLAVIWRKFQSYTEKAAILSRICSNCSQHKQHVVVPFTGGQADAISEDVYFGEYVMTETRSLQSKASASIAHDARSSRQQQCLEVETCTSLDCVLFYDKIKLQSIHDDLIPIIAFIEREMAVTGI